MRLRNVKNANFILESSSYFVSNPTQYKTKLKELFENEKRLTEVRDRYFELFEKFKDTENIIVIDGTKSIGKISDDIWENVSKYFTRKGDA